MKNALMMLLAAALLAAGGLPADAQASTKKKVVATKKPAPRAASRNKAPRPARAAQRGASLDDAQHVALPSTAVLVQAQATGAVLL